MQLSMLQPQQRAFFKRHEAMIKQREKAIEMEKMSLELAKLCNYQSDIDFLTRTGPGYLALEYRATYSETALLVCRAAERRLGESLACVEKLTIDWCAVNAARIGKPLERHTELIDRAYRSAKDCLRLMQISRQIVFN